MSPPIRCNQCGEFTLRPWTPCPHGAKWTPSGDATPRQHELPPRLADDWNVEPPRNLGRFNCRGDYVVENEKIPAERLGIRPAYGPVDEELLAKVGELGMTLRLTKAELTALNPCGLEDRLALFGRRKFMTAAQALEAGVSIEDLLWVAGRMGRKDLCVKFALACAQRVAHLNPDPRVQAALDATQAWLDNPCEETQRAAAWAAAAWAAEAAAWAAEAAADERAAQRAIFLEIFK